MSIVESVSVDTKGVKIGNAWFNYSKYSKIVNEEKIKEKLSLIKKGDSIELVGVNKNFFDDINIHRLNSCIDEVKEVKKSIEITDENVHELFEKSKPVIKLSCLIRDELMNKYGKMDGTSFEETVASILRWVLWK